MRVVSGVINGRALILLAFALAGCRSGGESPEAGDPPAPRSAEPVIRFTEVAAPSGITFRYTFGDFTYDNILESSGSGVVLFDYDADGWLDIYFLNGRYLEDISDPKGRVFRDAGNPLYRNLGDGTFRDVTAEAGVAGTEWHMAAGIADFDGDGFEDIFLANYGPNIVYRNNGDGTFTDVTAALGLAGPETLNGFTTWSVAAAPFDADGDGDLDLLVGNFLAFDPYYLTPDAPERMPAPAAYDGQPSIFYRCEGPGRYVDATREAGLYFPRNKVMGLTVFDVDEDGDLDIFQANDHQRNFLLLNDGRGRFEEVGVAAGVAVNEDGMETGSMHGSLGDVDGDGLIDIFVSDLRYGSLYRRRPDGRYEDLISTSRARPALQGREAWGGGLHDFDNDGDLDLFSTNGAADVLGLKRPTLLANDGSGRFLDVADAAGSYFATERSGRGAAFGDLDNDGDIDIVVSHVDLQASPAVLRNDSSNNHHWVGIQLVPTHGPAEPVGARVRVTAGGREQVRVYQRTQSYLSSNDPRLHFGLGTTPHIESVEVRWPGGAVQTLRDVPADKYHTIVEP